MTNDSGHFEFDADEGEISRYIRLNMVSAMI